MKKHQLLTKTPFTWFLFRLYAHKSNWSQLFYQLQLYYKHILDIDDSIIILFSLNHSKTPYVSISVRLPGDKRNIIPVLTDFFFQSYLSTLDKVLPGITDCEQRIFLPPKENTILYGLDFAHIDRLETDKNILFKISRFALNIFLRYFDWDRDDSLISLAIYMKLAYLIIHDKIESLSILEESKIKTSTFCNIQIEQMKDLIVEIKKNYQNQGYWLNPWIQIINDFLSKKDIKKQHNLMFSVKITLGLNSEMNKLIDSVFYG